MLCKAFHDLAPAPLSSLISFPSPTQTLHSSHSVLPGEKPMNLCFVRRVKVRSIQLHINLFTNPSFSCQVQDHFCREHCPNPNSNTCSHSTLNLSFTAFITITVFEIICDYFIHLFLHTDCKAHLGQEVCLFSCSSMSPVEVLHMPDIE